MEPSRALTALRAAGPRDHGGGTQARLTQPCSQWGEGSSGKRDGGGGVGERKGGKRLGGSWAFWAAFTVQVHGMNETPYACILASFSFLFVYF